jgi:hypothetical protein
VSYRVDVDGTKAVTHETPAAKVTKRKNVIFNMVVLLFYGSEKGRQEEYQLEIHNGVKMNTILFFPLKVGLLG